jgi:hypothetical protein
MVHQVIHLSRYPVHFTVQYEDAMFAYGEICLPGGRMLLPFTTI